VQHRVVKLRSAKTAFHVAIAARAGNTEWTTERYAQTREDPDCAPDAAFKG
jgi:hypothetical protein